MAEVAELATVAEMVAVKQAGRGGRDENRQQARQRKNGREANRETPDWIVNLHVLPFDATGQWLAADASTTAYH